MGEGPTEGRAGMECSLKGSLEMKYLILAVALVASLATADFAEARGRRGCSSCGGCPGGVCAVPAAPVQKGYAEAAKPEAAVVAATAPAPQTTTVATYRRLFRRR